MSVTAIVNVYKGEEAVTTVELEDAPLPQKDEIVYLSRGPYRVQQVIQDGWNKEVVDTPEIILKVTDADNYDG